MPVLNITKDSIDPEDIPKIEDEDSLSELDDEFKDSDQVPMHEPWMEDVFESNEENILDNAVYVYDYVNKVLGIDEKNIIVFGRSMGSGPACHVASKRKPGALLLMSAFKSIRAIA